MLTIALLSSAHAVDVLPVKRIRFYEAGVAWFVREGVVTDTTTLPVPTSHLDDALKTLVILGGDVDLGAITFPTALGDDAARVSAGLPSEEMGFREALGALLGVSVTVETSTGTMEGVLIDVSLPLEVREPTPDATEPTLRTPQFALTVLTSAGSLQRFTTDQVRSVRSEEAEVTERLATASRTMARTRALRPNALDLQLRKGGHLGLGYLADAAVWRVSYRILDPEGGSASLQAWALIHNDTDEPWDRVQIELANGEPDSFLYPLAAPRYAERELRTPDRDLATVSQLATTTPDAMWSSDAAGFAMGMGGIGYGSGGGSSLGGAIAHGSIGSVATTLMIAEPVQTPTQFVYQVRRPVTLAAHHTALMPIVQEGVPTEAVVAFSPRSTAARSGVWLKNGTHKTLPAGVLSVVQSGGLAGEARLERLKPDETQLVTFGNELDVDLERSSVPREPVASELAFASGLLTVSSTTRTDHTLDVRNRTERPQALWVGLELGPDERVVGPWRTEVDPHTGWTWVVLPHDPGATQTTIPTERATRNTLEPPSVSAATWLRWAELAIADPAVLKRAHDLRVELDALAETAADRIAEQARAQTELDGLRASLTAAEGSSGAQPLARKAASVEAELRRLTDKAHSLESTRRLLVERLLAVLAPLEDGAVTTD